MLRTLLDRGYKIRYRPDMVITHHVDSWKLKRRYFLKLHYLAGLRRGLYQLPQYPHTILGVPPFLVSQYLRQSLQTLGMLVTRRPGTLRQAMNTAHALGMLIGYTRKNRAAHTLA